VVVAVVVVALRGKQFIEPALFKPA